MKTNSLLTLLISCCLVALTGCSSEPAPSDAPVAEAEPAAEPAPAPPAAESKTHINLDERGRALRGYDAVAYFTEGKAVSGEAEFRADVDGAEYYFASAENRELFLADPARYQPSNGGYCTFGIVLHKKFDGDPEVWKIHDDRLFVFLNEEVQGKFLSDAESNYDQVEANWPEIRDRTAAELEAAAEDGSAAS